MKKMEDRLRRDIPSPSPDRKAIKRFRNELTLANLDSRSNSICNSSICLDSSTDFSNHTPQTAKPLTEWTNEKHRLYLDSLEASFVNELHRSMRLRSWCSRQHVTRVPTNSQNSSNQFMVLQDACWQKINFERNDPLMDSTADSPVSLESSWMHNFESTGKQSTLKTDLPGSYNEEKHKAGKLTNPYGSPTSSECLTKHHLCHNSILTTTEVSDQNFVDSDKVAITCGGLPKRLRKTTTDFLSNDQIVQFGRLHRGS